MDAWGNTIVVVGVVSALVCMQMSQEQGAESRTQTYTVYSTTYIISHGGRIRHYNCSLGMEFARSLGKVFLQAMMDILQGRSMIRCDAMHVLTSNGNAMARHVLSPPIHTPSRTSRDASRAPSNKLVRQSPP